MRLDKAENNFSPCPNSSEAVPTNYTGSLSMVMGESQALKNPVCEALRADRPAGGRVATPITLATGKPFAIAPSAGSPTGNKCNLQ